MTINIGRFLARRAAIDGAWPAVITPDRALSFSELNDYANRAANALAALSIGPGDRVAAVLRNGAEFCALYYAAAKLGAILCCVNWRLAPPEMAYILHDSGSRAIVFDAEFSASVGSALENSPVGVALRVGGVGAGAGFPLFEDAVSQADSSEPRQAILSDAPLVLCYTSGTTGRPKGAVLSHSQMFWVSASTGYTLDYRHHDANLISAPMFHVGGLSFATLFVHRGATAVMLPAWDPELALSVIRDRRINHFFAVPTMLETLLEAARRSSADLCTVRWILSGAAPMPQRLVRGYADLGIPLLQSYGCTETAGAATCMDLDHIDKKPGSIGKAFFHAEVRVVAARGGETAPDEVGEIQVRAPHVFTGYWNNESATQAAFAGDWLLTGDLGRRDEDGYLYVVDRKKNLIISGGENVYPAEVEQVLCEHPAIAEVAVVGAPDPKWGETVCAVVVLRPGHSLTLAEIRSYCQDRIASYKIPVRMTLSPQPLLRTATGKLVKSEIQALVQDDRSALAKQTR